MSLLRSFRRTAYRSASRAGDLEALASGDPSKIVKRYVRKRSTAKTLGLLARIFR